MKNIWTTRTFDSLEALLEFLPAVPEGFKVREIREEVFAYGPNPVIVPFDAAWVLSRHADGWSWDKEAVRHLYLEVRTGPVTVYHIRLHLLLIATPLTPTELLTADNEG